MWLGVLAGIYLSFGGALLYFVGGQLPEISATVGRCIILIAKIYKPFLAFDITLLCIVGIDVELLC